MIEVVQFVLAVVGTFLVIFGIMYALDLLDGWCNR